MLTNKYFLGYFVNENGESYCRVYDENAPKRYKIRAANTDSDVWNQVHFCSKQYFEQQKQAGWAK